jgi:hypothetical protein
MFISYPKPSISTTVLIKFQMCTVFNNVRIFINEVCVLWDAIGCLTVPLSTADIMSHSMECEDDCEQHVRNNS